MLTHMMIMCYIEALHTFECKQTRRSSLYTQRLYTGSGAACISFKLGISKFFIEFNEVF